jgi:hypothetical protein
MTAKRYEVLYRSADGAATYLAVTSEGSELLTISPEGTRRSVIEGLSGCLVPRKPRRNSALERAIIAALQPGNGRSNRAGSEAELIQRLVEDGFQFKPATLFTTLGVLVAEGRVVRRTGYGLWLDHRADTSIGTSPVGRRVT